ncbi:hypothetical protein HDU97_008332 [Phlyctochytrium planicorne]|nr:hypothetical protein HDU97_008332 [Phlyctochytrium planicorne]
MIAKIAFFAGLVAVAAAADPTPAEDLITRFNAPGADCVISCIQAEWKDVPSKLSDAAGILPVCKALAEANDQTNPENAKKAVSVLTCVQAKNCPIINDAGSVIQYLEPFGKDCAAIAAAGAGTGPLPSTTAGAATTAATTASVTAAITTASTTTAAAAPSTTATKPSSAQNLVAGAGAAAVAAVAALFL